MINQECTLSPEQREDMINSFRDEMRSYVPNWSAIIEANEPRDKYFSQETQKTPVESFCDAIKSIRKKMNLTQEQMGERLSCSRQNINKIEHKIPKTIPVDKLESISECFSVSVAYLLGLIDDDSIEPDITEYYFWEHPNSEYLAIKDEVVNKPLIYPLETFGVPKEVLIKRLTENLKNKLENKYDVIVALNTILELPNAKKRTRALSIIENLSKIF